MGIFQMLENIFSQELVQRLGWTLVHFLWQGAAVAILLAVALRLLRKASADARYCLACAALGLIVLLPIVTLRMVDVSVLGVDLEKMELAGVVVSETTAMPVVEIESIEDTAPLRSRLSYGAAEISLRERFVGAVEPMLPYVVVGWFVGVFGLSVWHLGGWCQLQKLRRKSLKSVIVSLQKRLKELARRLGISRIVSIAESGLVHTPTVIGWLRPVILLPGSALTGLTTGQLEAILAHELAHIKRCDYLVNILQTVVEILGFYHPGLWWVSAKIRAERENCCDDLAVSISRDRLTYARALTSMAEIRPGNLAIAATGGSLLERIRRLVGKDHSEKERAGWLPSVVAIVLVLALLLPAALALSAKDESRGQSAEPVGDVQVEVKNSRQAQPLKDFERKLIGQVFDLAKKIEKEYPEQATHWPARAGLYHADGQGQVTVWHYRHLRRKSINCEEDEVGWGSSRLVNATGMYYLPDGTPLQSSWSERGNGMKDIRIKVGRTVDENERVALIHRHRLPSDHDLLSRDGLKKNIRLSSWKSLPLALIVRVDRPMRLGECWVGDIETDIQHFDEYDQLIVSAPPSNDYKAMFVTVRLPEPDMQVEGNSKSMKTDSIAAAESLWDFGDAVIASEKVEQMLSEAQRQMLLMNTAYQKEDLASVNETAKQIRDIFRKLVSTIQVEDQAAVQAKYLAQDGHKITKEQVELVGLFDIKMLLSGISEREKGQLNFYQLIHDIAEVSDELHDAIRDKETYIVPGYYGRLTQQWKLLAELKSIDELLHKNVLIEGTLRDDFII